MALSFYRKNVLFFIVALICHLPVHAQFITVTEDSAYIPEIRKYQATLNAEYADPETSPLDSADLARFSALNMYPINMDFYVSALFKKTQGKKFKMKTSTDRLPLYKKYGELSFYIYGQPYTLSVYQNIELAKQPAYQYYFFLPFTDLTNGETTYGGGRYIDLYLYPDSLKSTGNYVVVDFNKAYNPYCAYTHKYSCPIPPAENFLNIKIEVGVKEGLIYK